MSHKLTPSEALNRGYTVAVTAAYAHMGHEAGKVLSYHRTYQAACQSRALSQAPSSRAIRFVADIIAGI